MDVDSLPRELDYRIGATPNLSFEASALVRHKRVGTIQGHSNRRLLLLLPDAFEHAGGIQMFCRTLCLAAGNWAKDTGAYVSAIALNDSIAPDERYVAGLENYYGAGSGKLKFVARYLREMTQHRYDWTIFAHVSLSSLAAPVKLFNPAAKICIVTYGLEVWRPLSRIHSQALRRADVVLAISDYTKNELIKHTAVPPEKIRIFPCALDPYWDIAPIRTELESIPPILLSVARLSKDDHYKGVDNVIRSLPKVLRDTGPVEYRIVGQGDDVLRLRALAQRLGVGRYVNFMGGLSDTELREQYRCCSVFILPSKEEGFGIVFLEAMAHAKPVIGGAHGGTTSVVENGETGILLDNSDVPGIAHSITRLLGDPVLREKFGRAGYRRLLDHFTFSMFEQHFSSLCSSLG
jgi:phosphatidyl-myo-inositol dimannoside synthase